MVALFLFSKEMMSALAPFSYLIKNIVKINIDENGRWQNFTWEVVMISADQVDCRKSPLSNRSDHLQRWKRGWKLRQEVLKTNAEI
jgi:hypothetical protein